MNNQLTNDDIETIRIHLNAFKETLCNQRRWKEAEEYQRIIDRFMEFASAQPDSIESSLTQNALDTISILSELRSNYNCFASVDKPYYHALSEAIRALSAERKGYWISLDDFRGRYNEYGYRI